jgi:hypothetical protein
VTHLQRTLELFNCETGVSNDAAHRKRIYDVFALPQDLKARFFKCARQGIADRVFSGASCSVAPCDQHPGSAGQDTQ